jgi:hypothetical protein
MFYISMILSRFKLEDFSHSVKGNRMAGRVNHWTKSPDRPSPKSDTLILHFAVDVKRLVEEGKDFCWPRPERCPRCEGCRLWGHGHVQRYFEGWCEGIWVRRYRCPDCRAVHTLRPERFYKGFYYSILTILLSLLRRIIHNRWLKCLSRQVQQYWWKGLRRQASRFQNVKEPDRVTLGQLLREGIIPVTHSFQCEILRL